MPLYEYKCRNCGAVLEVIQKVGESQLKECLKCGGPLEKIISAPALQFKGEGWYVTDYAQKKSTEDEKPADKQPKPTKTDSKKAKKDKTSPKE